MESNIVQLDLVERNILIKNVYCSFIDDCYVLKDKYGNIVEKDSLIFNSILFENYNKKHLENADGFNLAFEDSLFFVLANKKAKYCLNEKRLYNLPFYYIRIYLLENNKSTICLVEKNGKKYKVIIKYGNGNLLNECEIKYSSEINDIKRKSFNIIDRVFKSNLKLNNKVVNTGSVESHGVFYVEVKNSTGYIIAVANEREMQRGEFKKFYKLLKSIPINLAGEDL